MTPAPFGSPERGLSFGGTWSRGGGHLVAPKSDQNQTPKNKNMHQHVTLALSMFGLVKARGAPGQARSKPQGHQVAPRQPTTTDNTPRQTTTYAQAGQKKNFTAHFVRLWSAHGDLMSLPLDDLTPPIRARNWVPVQRWAGGKPPLPY